MYLKLKVCIIFIANFYFGLINFSSDAFSIVVSFADDKVILIIDDCHCRASCHTQEYLSSHETWLRKWQIKINGH